MRGNRMIGYADDEIVACPGPEDPDPPESQPDEDNLYGRFPGCPTPEDDDGGKNQ
jgi:hypothetical protein